MAEAYDAAGLRGWWPYGPGWATQNAYEEINFSGLTHMGLHPPGPISYTLWFWLTFWVVLGAAWAPWPDPMGQQKSLTLMEKRRFLIFNSGIQCWFVIVFGQILVPFVCPPFIF